MNFCAVAPPAELFTAPLYLGYSLVLSVLTLWHTLLVMNYSLYGVPEWNAEREIWLLIRERPLLQGVPSFKIVHRTILKFTLCGAHDVGAFAVCGRRRGFHPRPDDPFEKGSIENFSFLDKI